MPIQATKAYVWNDWEPEQFEYFLKKYLNLQVRLTKTLTKNLKCFWVCLKSGKKFIQLLGMQSEVAPSIGSNLQFNFFMEIEPIKYLFVQSMTWPWFLTKNDSKTPNPSLSVDLAKNPGDKIYSQPLPDFYFYFNREFSSRPVDTNPLPTNSCHADNPPSHSAEPQGSVKWQLAFRKLFPGFDALNACRWTGTLVSAERGI